MSTARYYDESKNTDGRFISGVPLRDIEDQEWEQLAPHLQRSVDASPLWRKTKPRPEKEEGDN